LFGSYSKITYGAAGNTLLAALGSTLNTIGFISAVTSGNADFSVGEIGTKTSWMPVKDLTFSAEFLYARIMPNFTGTFTNGRFISGAQGGSVWTIGAQNSYSGSVQVIRSF
jgi:hypothetical protein